MSFYNLLSAILFFSAYRQALAAMSAGNAASIICSGLVALLVINDVIYTSWLIEIRKKPYATDMLMCDLFNFVMLSSALLCLNPGKDNLFQLDCAQWLPEHPEYVFWTLLALYWIGVMLWTWKTGVYDEPRYPKCLIVSALGLPIFFIIQAIFAFRQDGAVGYMRCLAGFYPLLYIIIRGSALKKAYKT